MRRVMRSLVTGMEGKGLWATSRGATRGGQRGQLTPRNVWRGPLWRRARFGGGARFGGRARFDKDHTFVGPACSKTFAVGIYEPAPTIHVVEDLFSHHSFRRSPS